MISMLQDSFQKIALAEIEKLALLLKKEGFSTSTVDKKLYNFEIVVNKGKDEAKILVYFGKKGIKKVLQGSDQTSLFKELSNIIYGAKFAIPEDESDVDFENYIGTDESGKGDYFGPLVTASVYVDKNSKIDLEKLGVKDSKLLNDAMILSLEHKIRETVNNKFDIVIISPEKYNQLYESFLNLNKLLGWAHSKAIENLANKVNCKNVISDKFGNEQIIKSELAKKNLQLNLYQTPKAERFIGVAAASILARAKVIHWFQSKEKELGIKLQKGASNKVETIAREILKSGSDNNLRKLIKFHFKNSKNIF